MSAMSDKSKSEKFVRKLVDDTRAGKLNWNVIQPDAPSGSLSEHYINFLYRTDVAGKTVQVGEIRYPYFLDEDKYVFEERAIIEFVDHLGNVEWRFPPTSYTLDLLEAARTRAFDVEDAIDRYLAES